MSAPRRAVTALASFLLHLAVVGVAGRFSPEPPRERAEPARSSGRAVVALASTLARPVVATKRRAALVASARRARALGTLELGAFILASNAIDAEEEGASFDAGAASARYRERVASLVAELARVSPEQAAPKVFGDLRYAGMPGGRMGDTLLSGSGSCEPLAQLVAASLYDAGLRDKSQLRYYGGMSSGVSHLTAVIRAGAVERDLILGGPSEKGGRAFVASELVEAYARAHGLTDDAASSTKEAADDRDGLFADTPRTRTMTSGYPANDDVFAGALPLYAARAVAEPSRGAKGERGAPELEMSDERLAESCAVLLRLGELDPPDATIETEDGPLAVTLHHVPTTAQLERTATNVAELERAKASVRGNPLERLVALGCLAGLYDRAALQFSFAREPSVAERAVREARRARKEGAEIIRSLELDGEAGRGARKELLRDASIGAWVLVHFEGGDAVVERLAREAPDDSFVAVQLTTALVVSPRARARGIALAASLPLDTQILVMQELSHAHDDARPWSATYDPDPASFGDSDDEKRFALTYRVLRPVAWRLWEVASPPRETIAALLADAKREGLEPERTRAILSYFVQNALWLYSRREDATRLFGELDRGLVDNGLGGLLDFDDIKPYPADARAIRAALDAYAKDTGRR